MTTITASQEHQVVDQVPKQLYIAGEWRDGAKGTLTVEDPSTAEALCDVADASVDDAKAALDAAVDAGPEFAAMAPRERGEILRRAFEMITERKDDLALLMTLEMGKTIKESLARSPTRPSSSAGSPRRRSASTAATRSRPTAPGGS